MRNKLSPNTSLLTERYTRLRMNITIMKNYFLDDTEVSVNQSTLCLLFLTFIFNFVIINSVGIFKRKRYPNGPWGVPVLGHLPFFGRSPPHTFAKWRKQYGDVFRIRLGSWNTVIVNGYQAIKEAADKPDDDFSGRPGFMTRKILEKIIGESSLAFGPFNDVYIQRRKHTAAALRMFTSRVGKLTEEMILDQANVLVSSLLSKDFSEPRNIKPEIQYAAASVIYQLLYGPGTETVVKQRLDSIVDSANKFIKFTGNGNPVDVMPWLRYVMPWKVSQFVEIISANNHLKVEQIKEHVETFSNENIRDIADALLAADLRDDENSKTKSGLTRSILMSTLGDLQGAGFDTSNKTLQWLLIYMAVYPDVQKRVQAEIDDVIGYGRKIQLKDRAKLVYTDATIQEVMRITSLAPFALPKLTTKDTILNGFDIDKDTVVFFNLHSIHHDTELWGDPEKFRPSRLITTDNQLDLTKCARILPFGLGRRRCIGEFLAKMEIFLMFSTVMQRCSIVKPEDLEFDLNPVPGLVYSPNDFKVFIKER